jgi:hypothetical protein
VDWFIWYFVYFFCHWGFPTFHPIISYHLFKFLSWKWHQWTVI